MAETFGCVNITTAGVHELVKVVEKLSKLFKRVQLNVANTDNIKYVLVDLTNRTFTTFDAKLTGKGVYQLNGSTAIYELNSTLLDTTITIFSKGVM